MGGMGQRPGESTMTISDIVRATGRSRRGVGRKIAEMGIQTRLGKRKQKLISEPDGKRLIREINKFRSSPQEPPQKKSRAKRKPQLYPVNIDVNNPAGVVAMIEQMVKQWAAEIKEEGKPESEMTDTIEYKFWNQIYMTAKEVI